MRFEIHRAQKRRDMGTCKQPDAEQRQNQRINRFWQKKTAPCWDRRHTGNACNRSSDVTNSPQSHMDKWSVSVGTCTCHHQLVRANSVCVECFAHTVWMTSLNWPSTGQSSSPSYYTLWALGGDSRRRPIEHTLKLHASSQAERFLSTRHRVIPRAMWDRRWQTFQ